MSDEKTCGRPGCGKTLMARNKKGVCTSGCRSPEASDSVRASDVEGSAPSSEPRPAPAPRASKRSSGGTALERFRIVTEALGQDADELMESFAESWLAEIRSKLEE